ncbi:MAG: hypothetical protein JO277_08310 [Candidatus Eremiobacteraeota bacterium]|nr:hypothetical protein [Candidatus Eremiobacteraeota bacterium]
MSVVADTMISGAVEGAEKGLYSQGVLVNHSLKSVAGVLQEAGNIPDRRDFCQVRACADSGALG